MARCGFRGFKVKASVRASMVDAAMSEGGRERLRSTLQKSREKAWNAAKEVASKEYKNPVVIFIVMTIFKMAAWAIIKKWLGSIR